jgi:hypothetical protein
VAVDPGRYEIVVTAPGFRTWRTTATIRDQDVEITIPALELTNTANPKPKQEPSTRPRPLPAAEVTPDPVSDQRPRSPRPKIAVGIGIGGLASTGVGIVFGVKALDHRAEAIRHCPSDRCDQTGLDAIAAAKREMLTADIAIGIGLAAIVTGAVVWITAPSPRAGQRTARVVPTRNGAAFVTTF